MKKFYFKSIIALTALFGLGTAATADVMVGKGTVKMTYVDFNFPDSVFGQKDSILVGYNKVPAVGAAVGFGNTGWGCNWIGYVQVDVSNIPGVIQKAVLKAQVSGCTAPDASKTRNSAWGVALTDAAWSNGLTYNNTNATFLATKILNNGQTVGGTGGHKDNFSDIELDITDAVAGGDASKIVTLMVYETAAEGAYFTTPVVEVEYDPFEATSKTIDFEDDDVSMFGIFDAGRLTIAAEANEEQGSKVAKFTCVNRNALPLGLYDFSEMTKQAALVAFDFDFNIGEVAGHHRITIGDALVHNGQTGGFNVTSKNNFGYGAEGAIFQFGANRGNLGAGNENFFSINDVAKAASTTELKASDVFGKWMHAKVIVNVQARTVSYVISTKDGEVVFADSGLPFFNENANACTEFDVSFSNTGASYIDNLTITSYKSNAVFADYSVRYIDANGNELKESRSGNGQVGKYVTLVDADKAAIYNDDKTKKYIYDADNSETVAIAEAGTEILVMFREASVYYAVLNCKAGSKTLKQFRGDDYKFFEGDNLAIYPPRGLKNPDDGAYYFTPATSWNGATYNFPGALMPATQAGKTYYIGQLDYEKVDSVAYYADIETLALPTTDEGNGVGLGQLVGTVNSWYSFSGTYFDRFSGARGIRLDEGSYVYTEPIAEAGTYLVTIYGRNDVSAAVENPYVLGILKEDGTQLDYADLAIPTWGSATTGTSIVEGVAIPAGAKLVIKNDSADKKISFDDISLTKTGEYADPNLVNGIQEAKISVANGAIFSISGQRLNAAPAKGLFIQNGKKYVK